MSKVGSAPRFNQRGSSQLSGKLVQDGRERQVNGDRNLGVLADESDLQCAIGKARGETNRSIDLYHAKPTPTELLDE